MDAEEAPPIALPAAAVPSDQVNSVLPLSALSVCIIDDQGLMVEAIEMALRQVERVRVAHTLSNPIGLTSVTAPDLIVSELVFDGAADPSVVKYIRDTAPHSYVLIHTSSTDVGLMLSSVSTGVDGYLLKKETNREALAAAIYGITTHSFFPISAELISNARTFVPAIDDRVRQGGFVLTPTERALASHLYSGSTVAQIAQDLKVSNRTVERYVAKLLAKLEAESHFAAGAHLAKLGIL